MSWSELERLVEEAETDEVIRRGLRHCRSCQELILAARRLGYRVTRVDLHRAWQLQHPAG
ncbi:Nif11 family protein [Microcystis elabens FACHB-917]|nr:Nif11 family protein [Microcystis elabens FACHB-917]